MILPSYCKWMTQNILRMLESSIISNRKEKILVWISIKARNSPNYQLVQWYYIESLCTIGTVILQQNSKWISTCPPWCITTEAEFIVHICDKPWNQTTYFFGYLVIFLLQLHWYYPMKQTVWVHCYFICCLMA